MQFTHPADSPAIAAVVGDLHDDAFVAPARVQVRLVCLQCHVEGALLVRLEQPLHQDPLPQSRCRANTARSYGWDTRQSSQQPRANQLSLADQSGTIYFADH